MNNVHIDDTKISFSRQQKKLKHEIYFFYLFSFLTIFRKIFLLTFSITKKSPSKIGSSVLLFYLLASYFFLLIHQVFSQAFVLTIPSPFDFHRTDCYNCCNQQSDSTNNNKGSVVNITMIKKHFNASNSKKNQINQDE